MKSDKTKILLSSFCLVAALALAIFTVYAWFTTNERVRSSGIDSVVTSGDVLSFEIDYYKTEYDKKNDKYIIRDKIDPYQPKDNDDAEKKPLKGRKLLPDYDNGSSTTAVLVDMKITFAKPGRYYLSAQAIHGNDTYNGLNPDEFINNNYLSNVILMREYKQEKIPPNEQQNLENITIRKDATQYNFITKDGKTNYFATDDHTNYNRDKKIDHFDLFNNTDKQPYIVNDGETGEDYFHHLYYLMDYMPEQISALYTIMLSSFPNAITLNTPIVFLQDIAFVIGKYED